MKRTIKLTPILLQKYGMDFNIEEIPEQDRIVKRIDLTEKVCVNEEEEKTATGFMSTISIDADNEVILPDALDFSRFSKNSIVLFQHDLDRPIGKVLETQKTDTGVLAKVVFGSSSFAGQIWKLVKDGILKSFSIGFIPRTYLMPGTVDFKAKIEELKTKFPLIFNENVKNIKRIITGAEVLELSVVSIPSNENSVMLAVKSFEEQSMPIVPTIECSHNINIIGTNMNIKPEIKIERINIIGRDPNDYVKSIQKMMKGRI